MLFIVTGLCEPSHLLLLPRPAIYEVFNGTLVSACLLTDLLVSD
jgi:hypothetical protein